MAKQHVIPAEANREAAQDSPPVSSAFVLRVLAAAAIVVGVFGALYLLSQVVEVLFFIFGGVLFALFLHSTAQFITDHTGLWPRVSLTCVLLTLLAVFVGVGFLAGPELSRQAQTFGEKLPESIDAVRAELSKHYWTQELLNGLPTSGVKLLAGLPSLFTTATEGVALVVLSIFVGIYSAADPRLYLESLLHLVPPTSRNRARQIGNRLRRALGWWLAGRVITMTLMGFLTLIGLCVIHMPMVLPLAIISGLFQFVPYLGAFAAAAPAVLIGFLTSPTKALEVAGLYLLIHSAEGYLVTPMIQRYAVSLPPAVLISVQLLMALLFGLTGVIFATPVAVAVIVLVQTLYVRDLLEDRVPVLGQ